MPPIAVKNSKKINNAWAFYDWANSVYPLVITTAIFPIFYENLTSTKIQGNAISDSVVLGLNNDFSKTNLYQSLLSRNF